MTEVSSMRPIVAVLIPAVAVCLIGIWRARPAIRDSWTLAAALGQAAVVASLVPGTIEGVVYSTVLGTLVPGISFVLRADPLGVLFALVASALWLVASVYNIGYTRRKREHAQTRYFAAFAGTLAATAGVAFAGNLLVMFVFYELLTVATYPLVTHKGSEAARRSGRKYVGYTFGGGVLVFAGTAAVVWLTGTVTFTPGGLNEFATVDPTAARVAFGLLIAGFGVKAAIMPVHSWLPEAMVAPTPVSGLLHAVAVVKSGVFGITRVVLDVYGIELMGDLSLGMPLAVIAAVTTLTASLFALKQDNIKRLLAYSTVSQLSYIILGLGVLSPAALYGGLFHIPAHAVMKLLLFLCAGAISVELHLESIDEMAGIGWRMPVTMSAFAVGAMGMIGIPLTAGFVSKFYLVLGSLDAGLILFAVVLLVNSVLKFVYFWPVVYQAFFETPEVHDPKPILVHPPGGYWSRVATEERTAGRDLGPMTTASGHQQSRYRRPRPDGGDPRSTGRRGTDPQATETVERGWTSSPADTSDRWTPFPKDPGHRSGLPLSETSWWLLGPIAVLALLAVLLGIVPGVIGVSDITARIVDAAVMPGVVS